MQENLKMEIEKAVKELRENLIAVPQNQLNEIPFEGSWTAAQVVDHILKSQKGVVQVVHGRTSKTSRDPAEKIQQLNEIFLDFTTRMKSPEFIKPSSDPLNKQDLLSRIDTIGNQIQRAVTELDLSLTCTDFEFPGMAALTRLEWLNFFVVHTVRHNHQLKNIRHRLNSTRVEA